MLNELLAANVGDRIRFEEEKKAYTIQAKGPRYLVCTKPFNLKHTVLYTVVDLEEGVRGTENLIFGAGAETRQQCEEMLMRMEGRDTELGWSTEVSHRNRVPLNVCAVIAANGWHKLPTEANEVPRKAVKLNAVVIRHLLKRKGNNG